MYHLMQLNDAAIDQGGALVNTCDETGGGVNQAVCDNVGDINILGPIVQFNAVDAPNSDTAAPIQRGSSHSKP